jgi:HEAT repeat protein
MTARRSPTSGIFLPALLVMAAASAQTRAADEHKASPEKERQLIGVLKSDAAPQDKAVACKGLAVDGSSEAVPELAKLLADKELASWARIALEAIPGPAPDEALRNALDSLEGRLLVGTINSIGVRRDAGAAEKLIARLEDKDAEVASASAVALGHIGNASAAKSLKSRLAAPNALVRSAVAEGCVLCAERFLSEGKSAEAKEIYDAVRKAEVPKQRVLEATRGAILSRKNEGIALLLEQFRSPDKALFQLSLGIMREFPGNRIDQALASELDRAAPDRAALLVTAMADRKDTVILPAVLKAASAGPKDVRLAAIEALGRVGDASCVTPLFEIARGSDADVVEKAKAALADLPGESIDKNIVGRLVQAQDDADALLIEVAGARRIRDAMPALLRSLQRSDKQVRSATLTSLGAIVDLKALPVLIRQVAKPTHAEDSEVAQQALKTACIRMPEREQCAVLVADAIEDSPASTKAVLLQILGAMGGTKSLETIGAAAGSSDANLQDVASRLLGEWMTADAAPVLLELAKTGPAKFQVRSLRGYIRIARQFVLPEDQRAAMCKNAFEAARQPAEQKLVLEVLKRYPNVENLKLAVQAAEVPELKEDAVGTALAIAQKVGNKSAEVEEALSKLGLPKVQLEIVKAEYGAGETQKDVTEILKKQAGDVPVITLPAAGYNASFGGDPVPNTAKQLKIQYKINGKPAEAIFAENALIVLPMPKETAAK